MIKGIPLAYTEATVRYGSPRGPLQTFYYCFTCATDPVVATRIPEDQAIIPHPHTDDEIALPGIF
jgi:hypothetical protein